MALVITGGGGLALLGGVLLIGRIVGSFDLDVVLAAGEQIRASALYPYALFLVLAGIFTKSAQFPFHSGCRTRWPRPLRSLPTCTRPPW